MQVDVEDKEPVFDGEEQAVGSTVEVAEVGFAAQVEAGLAAVAPALVDSAGDL